MDLEYLRASDGAGPAAPASVTTARSTGATTLVVSAVTNWPAKFIATYGVLNVETQTLNLDTIKVFSGHLDGTTIVIDSFAPGFPDEGNSVGDKVYIKPSTANMDTLVNFLEVAHNDNGTIKDTILDAVIDGGKTADNLRIAPRLLTSANIGTSPAVGTLTPNIDTYNQYVVTAQTTGLLIDNPTGTPKDGDVLIITLRDNGTARAITYGTAYENISGLDTLTATVANKWSTIGVRYNATAAKWHIVSITTGA